MGHRFMMGKKGGVVAKLKEENPDLIGIHFIADWLAHVTKSGKDQVHATV